MDIEAYLDRIGATRDASLAEIHRAHVLAIPFENLDPFTGVPPSLALDDLQDKLVTRRRGGYCFEQNLLLKGALEALGHRVEPLLARVTIGGTVRGRTHLVLRVDDVWHADVGFGLGGLLEPIPYGPGEAHHQSGWAFQNREDGMFYEGDEPQYRLEPEAVPHVDIEMGNWFTGTHPHSIFVTRMIVAIHRADGTRVSVSDREGLQRAEQTPHGRTVTHLDSADLAQTLATDFGLSQLPPLPGYTGDDGSPH